MVPLWLWLLVVFAALFVAMRLGRPRSRCSRCHRELPKADEFAERFAELAPDGRSWQPLCSSCFAGTFR